VWKKNAFEVYGDLMSEETWTADELFDGLTLHGEFIVEMERCGLIRVVARDTRGGSLYGAEARDELEKVLALVELGYKLEDIAAIAKRVGLPAKKRGLFRRPPLRMRSEELSRRSGVEKARIDRWVEEGYLRADLVSEGGDGLFGRSAIERIRLLTDLDDGGLGSEVTKRVLRCLTWSQTDAQTSEEVAASVMFLADLTQDIRSRREALRRLERDLAASRKRLIRAQHASDVSRRKTKRSKGRRKGAVAPKGEGA
jgi:DNA-binding transcriptional MerR regulator